jgi:hypothetical protein
MQEAMTKENWERTEKGLPPIRPEKVEKPEPKKPDIKNEIKFDDIPMAEFSELEYARRQTIKNAEGVRFIGFEVSIILKRKPGRPKESEKEEGPGTLTGWMNEGDFLKLNRVMRKKINQQVINW